jgi:hypothetical protein
MTFDLAHTEPTEPQAKAAFEVERRIRSNVSAMRGLWVRLAEDLHKFSDMEMWRDLGHTGFEAWLASPDIELERRWVYELIAMWRELVVKRDVAPALLEPLQVSKIREVLPAIRRGFVNIPDALADCETLARDDLRTKYSGVGTGGSQPASPNGKLDATTEQEFAICHACGSRYPVRRAA